jgi:hypothetical protein
MRASGYDRIAADFYCEPKWIVDALLDVEELPGMSWDPCCGGGNIPVTMRARGLPCRGSDIANWIRRDGRFLRGARHGGQHRYESALRHDRAVHRAGAGKDDGQVFVLAWLALLEGMRRHQMVPDNSTCACPGQQPAGVHAARRNRHQGQRRLNCVRMVRLGPQLPRTTAATDYRLGRKGKRDKWGNQVCRRLRRAAHRIERSSAKERRPFAGSV